MKKKVIYRIHDHAYERSETPIKVGDLVYDTKDGTYGYCDMIKGDEIALRDGPVTEVGIPIERCFKLVFTYDHQNSN